jgi:hypothetical protein
VRGNGMVPYLTKKTMIVDSYSSSGCTATTLTTTAGTTVTYGNQPYEELVITRTSIPKEEDLSLPLPKEKPKFERMMKMRNTDGRPIRYSLWKPVQMYNGRDNIGTRNYKKTIRA